MNRAVARCWLVALPPCALLLLGLTLCTSCAVEEGPVGGGDREAQATDATATAKTEKLPARGQRLEPPEEVTNSVGMTLTLIPEGEFLMGTPASRARSVWERYEEDSRREDEYPVHRVRITRPFYLGEHEVTNSQYRQFKPQHDSKYFLFSSQTQNQDQQPVVLVSWDDAVAFCRWLSEREGCLYRLPTEAEWEYACRAGAESVDYWWGDTLDPKKLKYDARNTHSDWFARNLHDGHATSAPVGFYPANPFGLHDMLGNVWEWCADWYQEDYYKASPPEDPAGPARGVTRVCRGGSWNDRPPMTRCGKRGRYFPTDGHYAMGFRVVRTVRSPKRIKHNAASPRTDTDLAADHSEIQ